MRTFPIFFILFLVIPIIEIFFLIKVGEVIGAFPTIILVVLTAVIGAGLLRQQGLSTLARFQKNLSTGKIPAQEMVEGILLAVGGALLMTPGFVTDTMGFLCLLPFSRKFIAAKVIKRSSAKFTAGMSGGSAGGFTGGFGGGAGGFHHDANNSSDNNVVEGEFTEVEEDPIVISPSDKSGKHND
ncbi:MAG: FxsA family protein [Cocleimonas sp.]